jgi:hypothetical protein
MRKYYESLHNSQAGLNWRIVTTFGDHLIVSASDAGDDEAVGGGECSAPGAPRTHPGMIRMMAQLVVRPTVMIWLVIQLKSLDVKCQIWWIVPY